MNRREVTKSGSEIHRTEMADHRIGQLVVDSGRSQPQSAVQSFCPMTSLADARQANAYQAKRSFADTDPIGDRIACHRTRFVSRVGDQPIPRGKADHRAAGEWAQIKTGVVEDPPLPDTQGCRAGTRDPRREAVDHVCSDSAADGCLLLGGQAGEDRCRQTTSGGETGQTSTHHHNIDVLRGRSNPVVIAGQSDIDPGFGRSNALRLTLSCSFCGRSAEASAEV